MLGLERGERGVILFYRPAYLGDEGRGECSEEGIFFGVRGHRGNGEGVVLAGLRW